jgi:hypothetical protein
VEAQVWLAGLYGRGWGRFGRGICWSSGRFVGPQVVYPEAKFLAGWVELGDLRMVALIFWLDNSESYHHLLVHPIYFL